MRRPLLKYACHIDHQPDGSVTYTYRTYTDLLPVPAETVSAIQDMNGRLKITDLSERHDIRPVVLQAAVDELVRRQLLLDGDRILRQDGLVTGMELFWKLEAALFRFRAACPSTVRLARAIASGSVPLTVAEGFCVEQSHIVRNAPQEITLAIANASQDGHRKLLMDFYLDEYTHGEVLLKGLKAYGYTRDFVLNCVPLPATVGLVNTYNDLARRNSFLYAVAMINDESRPADPEPGLDSDPYYGLLKHFGFSEQAVRPFKWHANLDREKDHGMFFEEYFGLIPLVNPSDVAQAYATLRSVVELRDAVAAQILEYYATHDVASRQSTQPIDSSLLASA